MRQKRATRIIHTIYKREGVELREKVGQEKKTFILNFILNFCFPLNNIPSLNKQTTSTCLNQQPETTFPNLQPATTREYLLLLSKVSTPLVHLTSIKLQLVDLLLPAINNPSIDKRSTCSQSFDLLSSRYAYHILPINRYLDRQSSKTNSS